MWSVYSSPNQRKKQANDAVGHTSIFAALLPKLEKLK